MSPWFNAHFPKRDPSDPVHGRRKSTRRTPLTAERPCETFGGGCVIRGTDGLRNRNPLCRRRHPRPIFHQRPLLEKVRAKRRRSPGMIEPLETRIAPPSLAAFTDSDGDTYTVKLIG